MPTTAARSARALSQTDRRVGFQVVPIRRRPHVCENKGILNTSCSSVYISIRTRTMPLMCTCTVLFIYIYTHPKPRTLNLKPQTLNTQSDRSPRAISGLSYTDGMPGLAGHSKRGLPKIRDP